MAENSKIEWTAHWPEYKNFDNFPADLRVREFPSF